MDAQPRSVAATPSRTLRQTSTVAYEATRFQVTPDVGLSCGSSLRGATLDGSRYSRHFDRCAVREVFGWSASPPAQSSLLRVHLSWVSIHEGWDGCCHHALRGAAVTSRRPRVWGGFRAGRVGAERDHGPRRMRCVPLWLRVARVRGRCVPVRCCRLWQRTGGTDRQRSPRSSTSRVVPVDARVCRGGPRRGE